MSADDEQPAAAESSANSDPAKSEGPSDAEIRAAAAIAGAHRVSRPGERPDAPPAGPERGRFEQRAKMDFWEVLYERRTTRRFDPARPVPRAMVLELLDAALIAPTSCNLQMWDFVVVDEPEQREQLGRLSLQVLATPITIFVAYGKEYSEEGHANVQSSAAALQNMSLTAHALGLGTFWINQLGPRPEVGRILGLPADREVVAALAVGWPATYPKVAPRRRPFEHVVHWNHFGGEPIPSSPKPDDWSLELIRNYQQARVLNGNRYNKARPWEMAAALEAAERLAPRVDEGTPGDDAPRWLDVLPVHGLFTGAMSRQHRDFRWCTLELSRDVAEFALKRAFPTVKGEAFVWDPSSESALPDGGFVRISVLHRLEALPSAQRPELLATLNRLLAPDGTLLLRYVSRSSFHALANWMHTRRGGPGGVEYVLAPDPNLGPWEALDPGAVEKLVKAAGFVIAKKYDEEVVPSAKEVDFRTRNMSPAKAKLVRGAVGAARVLGKLPGIAWAFARSRTLVLRRG